MKIIMIRDKILILLISLNFFSCLPDEQTLSEQIKPIKIYTFSLEVTRGTVEIKGVKISAERPIANSGRIITGTFQEGTTIEITVTPIDGAKFNRWEGYDSNQETIKINGLSNLNLKANCVYEICPDDDCWSYLYTGKNDEIIFNIDTNGYHHVFPRWYNQDFGEFDVLIESSPTTKICQSSGVPVISSVFDSNAFYQIEGYVSFSFPLYNPFESLYTQGGNPIKVKDTIVSLDYFQGQIEPVVQETRIYHDVKDKMECYGWNNPNSGLTINETGNCLMYSKRKIGPLPRSIIGDTIKIYSNTLFGCGPNHSLSIKDSINVIILE